MQEHVAEGCGDLSGPDWRVRDAVGLGEAVEVLLRRMVGRGEGGRLEEQQRGRGARDVCGEPDMQSGLGSRGVWSLGPAAPQAPAAVRAERL